MNRTPDYFITWCATMAAALFFVAGVAFTTIPWNLGQHPGEPHATKPGEPAHMT